MIRIVSVNKIIVSTLRPPDWPIVCEERADEIKLSLEQLMGMAVFYVFKTDRNIILPLAVVNIITSDDVNKYGDKKLSQAMSDHGHHGDRKQRGSSYV